MITEELKRRLVFAVIEIIETYLDDVGNFSGALNRQTQLSRPLHAHGNTNSHGAAFHPTQSETMFVCFIRKRAIASTTNSISVHTLRRLLIAAHGIKMSGASLSAEVPGGSLSHAGRGSHQLSCPQ